MPLTKKTSNGAGGTGSQPDFANERLSSGTENYLLCLYRLWEDSETPTITQLTDTLKQLPSTEGLGTSVPSVSGMIRRMQRQDLVDIGSDKRIRLTKWGLDCGVDIARRHRLAEWLVVELLGMELRQAHIEAHRLEHGISPEFEEKLVERLGHPTRSPFGRPIPLRGQPEKPVNTKTLDSAPPNTVFTVDRVPEEDAELLRFLSEAGIVPDQDVQVVEAAPYRGVLIVKSAKDRVSIGYNVATQIVVRPVDGA